MNKCKPALADMERCTGCSLCMAVCPNGSIEMRRDSEGFIFPVQNDDCTGCGMCRNACPALGSTIIYDLDRVEQQAVCGILKDREVWQKSSSGGAFAAICRVWGDADTVIFGAEYDGETYSVRHNMVTGINNISAFHGSKYVQSEMGETLAHVRKLLNEGRRVIFSGTPCQVAALRGFAGDINAENLLCIDLLCHGVGSPGVFRDYTEHLEQLHGKKLVDFRFRNKKIRLGVHNLYGVRARFSDGTAVYSDEDWYQKLFLEKILCRRSCNECMFSNSVRYGDITIGDFKQMYGLIPEAPADRNGSVVICNTKAGAKVFARLEEYMDIYPCELKDIRSTNRPFDRTVRPSADRNAFFDDYACLDFAELYKKYRRKTSFLRRLYRNVPEKLKASVKKSIMRR